MSTRASLFSQLFSIQSPSLFHSLYTVRARYFALLSPPSLPLLLSRIPRTSETNGILQRIQASKSAGMQCTEPNNRMVAENCCIPSKSVFCTQMQNIRFGLLSFARIFPYIHIIATTFLYIIFVYLIKILSRCCCWWRRRHHCANEQTNKHTKKRTNGKHYRTAGRTGCDCGWMCWNSFTHTHSDTVAAGIKRFRFNLLCLLFGPLRQSLSRCNLYTRQSNCGGTSCWCCGLELL